MQNPSTRSTYVLLALSLTAFGPMSSSLASSRLGEVLDQLRVHLRHTHTLRKIIRAEVQHLEEDADCKDTLAARPDLNRLAELQSDHEISNYEWITYVGSTALDSKTNLKRWGNALNELSDGVLAALSSGITSSRIDSEGVTSVPELLESLMGYRNDLPRNSEVNAEPAVAEWRNWREQDLLPEKLGEMGDLLIEARMLMEQTSFVGFPKLVRLLRPLLASTEP